LSLKTIKNFPCHNLCLIPQLGKSISVTLAFFPSQSREPAYSGARKTGSALHCIYPCVPLPLAGNEQRCSQMPQHKRYPVLWTSFSEQIILDSEVLIIIQEPEFKTLSQHPHLPESQKPSAPPMLPTFTYSFPKHQLLLRDCESHYHAAI
jgi:hypothetical protein